MKIRLRKGLDLPIPGAPSQRIEPGPSVHSVALLGSDIPNTRVSLRVEVGDRVRVGQPLFADRRRPEICFPSPSAGTVSAVRRGHARKFVGVQVEVGGTESIELPAIRFADLCTSTRQQITERLLSSGDWIGLRARPGGRIPTPGTAPAAIFIRAMDSNPLAADAQVVRREREDDLRAGVAALSRLTDGLIYFCTSPGGTDSLHDLERVRVVEFAGPHPAGLVGTHIHHLLPVSSRREVWYIGYQDVIAIGRQLLTGRPDPLRVVSIAGPVVERPRLVRTMLGASTEDLVRGELTSEPCRIISGSLLSGRSAAQSGAFLGRYDEQVCAIAEPAQRNPQRRLSWWIPSGRKPRRFPRWRAPAPWTSERHGDPSHFFPLDLFERAFPLQLPVGPLLRALAAGDVRSASVFGVLELEEEDLALCSFLCAAKLEYGSLLRHVLDEIEEKRA